MQRKVLLLIALLTLAACNEDEALISPDGAQPAIGGDIGALEKAPEVKDLLAEGPAVVDAPKTESGFFESASSDMGQEYLAAVDSTINFEFNGYELNDKAKSLLTTQAEVILKLIEKFKSENKGGSVKVVVEGHTDERGTREYNLALGEKRATATAKFLEAKGVPSANIQVISYGKERPVLDEHTEEVWAINRRTVTILTN